MYFQSKSYLIVTQELKLRDNFNSIDCSGLHLKYVSDITGTGDKMMKKTHFCVS